jgi:hypothetical protein
MQDRPDSGLDLGPDFEEGRSCQIEANTLLSARGEEFKVG